MRSVCVVSGTRADYGLLYWTIRGIEESSVLSLQLCVTGMHLSPEFGLTYKTIEADGIKVDDKVEILLSSDTSVGISKSIGLGVISFSELFARNNPDIVLVLGDRFEILAATIAAMIANIPIAHCHGGEATEGLIDEAIRHSITKMSHLHFTSTEEYRKRVIQLGELPEHVYNVGALGIENINKLKLLSKAELEKQLGFSFGSINFLVTYHPVTLENSTAEEQFRNLLNALKRFPNANVVFTKPNADTNGRAIVNMIDMYVAENPNRAISFVSMGQLLYLSTLQFVDIVIGNSSSGLVEVPSFKIPTINIGDRQRGRIKAKSVIDCIPDEDSIFEAIEHGLSQLFLKSVKDVVNPYGKGNASGGIVSVLENIELFAIIKKRFYNLV